MDWRQPAEGPKMSDTSVRAAASGMVRKSQRRDWTLRSQRMYQRSQTRQREIQAKRRRSKRRTRRARRLAVIKRKTIMISEIETRSKCITQTQNPLKDPYPPRVSIQITRLSLPRSPNQQIIRIVLASITINPVEKEGKKNLGHTGSLLPVFFYRNVSPRHETLLFHKKWSNHEQQPPPNRVLFEFSRLTPDCPAAFS